MSDAREGRRSAVELLSRCRRARALVPAPRAGRGERARRHGGKASRHTILCRPLPGPATGNMEHGTSMWGIPDGTGTVRISRGAISYDSQHQTGTQTWGAATSCSD